MSKIHQLDPHVADLIAAGEVVERPASVVKELTENTIDAGADAVTVEIQRGGMSYIRVTDNGCGIEAEDCLTAFLRHATSKIRTEYDLEAIGTLGFRGEALAAIASVSRVELMTRTAEAQAGTSLELEGGVVRSREEIGCPKGTTFVVRDLFFNTPARQKFLKRDSAEGSAVFAVVQHAALSHPEVSFRFLREGKEELNTPGDGSLKSAVYAVLGRDMALGLLPCKGSGEDISIEGFVSQPVCCRGSRGGQFFFVNGRYVKSRTMQAALEQAYRNQKMVGKFPACVLHITTRLNGVDVNVHPTKTEVKFSNEKKLFDAVYYSVLAALEAGSGAPKASLEDREEARRPAREQRHDTVTPNQTFFRSVSAQEFRQELHSDARTGYTPDAPRRAPVEAALGETDRRFERFVPKQKPAQPLKRPPAAAPLPREWTGAPTAPAKDPTTPARQSAGTAQVTARAGAPAPDNTVRTEPAPEQIAPEQIAPAPETAPAAKVAPVEPAAEPAAAPVSVQTPAETDEPIPTPEPVPAPEETAPAAVTESAPAPEEPAASADSGQQGPDAPAEEAPAPAAAPEAENEPPEDTPDTPAWRLAGEVLHTYAIVERGDEVWLIDKHAAHERMNFDRLKALGHKPMRQMLLQPLVLRPDPREGEALLERLPLLEEFGFAVEDFGGGSLIVREAPDYLPAEQIESALEEIAQKLLSTGTADPEEVRDEVLHTMACKGAIKGGWQSGEEELLAVCDAVMRDQVRYCPHGRPVAIRLTKKDLEKQFKRA